MQTFVKYQHICRLNEDETEGLLEGGTCSLFPKIDGACSSIWFDTANDNYGIQCGSRNHQLSSTNTNQGFWKYVQDNKDKFLELFLRHQDIILYGEWLIPHSLKTYLHDAWKKFYVFDVYEDGKYLHYDEYSKLLAKYDIEFIPELVRVEHPTIEVIHSFLDKNNYLMQEDCVGEGIVIKNYDFINKYGRQVWAKVVTSEFKCRDSKEFRHKNKLGEFNTIENQIVDCYVTEAFVEKTKAKILNQRETGWRAEYTAELLGRCFSELIKEESFNMVKKFKMPTIDYKKLNSILVSKAKQVIGV